MERIKNLNFYQKGIILLMLLMSVIFAVIYPMTISRVGYLYNDTILVPKDENGTTVYSGKIDGTQVQSSYRRISLLCCSTATKPTVLTR